MSWFRVLAKERFVYFRYFYGHLRYRLFVNFGLNLMIGLLDGLGLAMFIPLLQLVDGEGETSSAGMGGLAFVVDGLAAVGLRLTLVSVLAILLGFFVLKGLATFGQRYYQLRLRLCFLSRLRYETIDGLGALAYKRFVEMDAGRIQNTLSGEVGRVVAGYSAYFATVQGFTLMLTYLAFAIVTNPQFAILVAAGGALTNVLYRQIYQRTKRVSRLITSGGHIFQELLIQKVACFKYLKATALMKQYDNRMKRSVDYIVAANKKIGLYSAILSAAREPMVIAVVVAVLLVQVVVLSGSVGGIILSLLFFYRSLGCLVNLQNSWNGFLNVSGSLENMTDFAEELRAGKEENGTYEIEGSVKSIVLEDCAFSYGEACILRGVSVGIRGNRTTAVVGESGSGKTTLANVVAGLIPVDEGRVMVDGVDYRNVNMPTLQRQVGYITQDPVIFTGTIYDNVTTWATKSEEAIAKFWDVVQQAKLAEFIRDLPKQEDALLGNNGIQISGGQKQRISIARELYKNASILIMDEATSALDSETEKGIQESIEALQGKYTVLIIAHRLSTIRHADNIIVLRRGRVVCNGGYQDLLENCDDFRRMTELQEL